MRRLQTAAYIRSVVATTLPSATDDDIRQRIETQVQQRQQAITARIC